MRRGAHGYCKNGQLVLQLRGVLRLPLAFCGNFRVQSRVTRRVSLASRPSPLERGISRAAGERLGRGEEDRDLLPAIPRENEEVGLTHERRREQEDSERVVAQPVRKGK